MLTGFSTVCWLLTGVLRPDFVDFVRVELAGMNDQAVPINQCLPFFNAEITQAARGWADSKLAIDTPSIGEVLVFWVIKDCDVGLVIPSRDPHADVRPASALSLGESVFLQS